MQTVQFQTVYHDGRIQIPEQYEDYVALDTAKIYVTINLSELNEQDEFYFMPKTSDTFPDYDELPRLINSKEWLFDREEANERR